jgi:hypothetical protein
MVWFIKKMVKEPPSTLVGEGRLSDTFYSSAGGTGSIAVSMSMAVMFQ